MKNPDQLEEVVFDAVRQLPPDERTAHLHSACGHDTELFQRLIARLTTLAEATVAADKPPALGLGPHQTVIVPPTEKIGDKIGNYRLIEEIGEGGFGVVYRAERDDATHRLVALKVIKMGMDTREVVARFQAESAALALMDHPNIAKVLESGVTTAGRPYFVMELVQGIPLTEYCDKYNLSTRERIALFMKVCDAIQHAHQKAVIHRDIKPSNILVSHSPDGAVPMVIDFGLAKAIAGHRLTDQTLVTGQRQFLGTLAYASPEQVEMNHGDIDTRTDIYSLGVVLYELLTGKIPFEVHGSGARHEDEMRRAICEEEPPLPSKRLSSLALADFKQIARQRQVEPLKLIHIIRGDLDWILLKALEKDRSRRYETANGLALDLGRHLKNEPVAARPPGTFYRLQKLVRRHRLVVAAGAAVVAALIVGFGISVHLFLQEREAHRQSLIQAAKSRQVARFLVEMIKGVQPSVALGHDTTLLRDMLDRTVGRINHDLKNDPDVEAELRNSIGEVYMALGEYMKAESVYREALAIRRKIFGNEHLAVAQSLHNLAALLREEGRLEEAEPLSRAALKMREKILGDEHPEVAASLHGLALVLQLRGNLIEAETALRECVAIREKQLADDWQTFQTRSLLGGNLLAQKKFPEAEPLILTGYDGMKQRQGQIPIAARSKLKEALQLQIQLYQATNRPELAAQWTSSLAELDDSVKTDVGNRRPQP